MKFTFVIGFSWVPVEIGYGLTTEIIGPSNTKIHVVLALIKVLIVLTTLLCEVTLSFPCVKLIFLYTVMQGYMLNIQS